MSKIMKIYQKLLKLFPKYSMVLFFCVFILRAICLCYAKGVHIAVMPPGDVSEKKGEFL